MTDMDIYFSGLPRRLTQTDAGTGLDKNGVYVSTVGKTPARSDLKLIETRISITVTLHKCHIESQLNHL